MKKATPMLASALLALALSVLPAHAALGDNVSSVQTDAARMKASVRIMQAEKYSVHEMDAVGGTTVRQYVSPAGKVFGVAWSGQTPPNLQQLLGSYYQQAIDSVRAEKAKHPGRHPVSLHTPGLVVEMTGHQRSFVGHAYVPDLMPASVQAMDIQ